MEQTVAGTHRYYFQSTNQLKSLMRNFYSQAQQERKKGKPICWHMSGVPKELLYAMNITSIMSEEFTSQLATKAERVSKYLEIAEINGFGRDSCSLHRGFVGALLSDDKLIMPRPNFMVGLTCMCDSLSKSSVAITEKMNIPLFLIDTPRAIQITPEDEIDQEEIQHYLDYYKVQYHALIKFLEEQTGTQLNQEKLQEICQLLNEALETWDEINEMRKAIPSPMSAFDELPLLSLFRSFLGTKEAVAILHGVKEEVAERIKYGQGAINNEKYRLLLLSGPVWCYDMDFLNYFEALGAVLVKVELDNLWTRGRLDPENPGESWGKRLILNYSTLDSLPAHIVYIKKLVRNYKADGVIFLSHWGCRVLGGQHSAIKEVLYQEFGIPSLILDGDICDIRHRASRDQDLNKIEEFIEILE